MPTFRIPAPLRKLTDNKDEVRAAGATVRAAIDDLERQHAGVKARIFDDAGGVKKFIKLYVGDEDIAALQGLDTPVDDRAEISIVPAIAGGM
jgi:molybdopterin converting factor small subunit